MANIGKFVTGVVVVIIGTAVYLGAASSIWVWFVMPLFGVRAATYAELLGLGVASSLWFKTINKNDSEKKGFDSFAESSLQRTLLAGLCWLFAWVYHLAVVAGY